MKFKGFFSSKAADLQRLLKSSDQVGLGSSLHYFERASMPASGEEVWIRQDALQQADPIAYICSVASPNKKTVQSFKKPIVTKFLHILEERKANGCWDSQSRQFCDSECWTVRTIGWCKCKTEALEPTIAHAQKLSLLTIEVKFVKIRANKYVLRRRTTE